MRREIGYNQKSSFSRKLILSGKLNVEMTPSWVLRVFRAARYHKLHSRMFLIEKDGLLLTPNIRFYDAQTS